MVALQQIREGNLVDDSDFEYNDDFGYWFSNFYYMATLNQVNTNIIYYTKMMMPRSDVDFKYLEVN